MNQIQKRGHISNVLSIMITVSALFVLVAVILNEATKNIWMMLGLGVLACIPVLFILWSLIRIKRLHLDQATKALWSLVILLFPVIGAIVSIYMTSEETKQDS